MSTILGICSIDTGQASTQAPQVVHSHMARATRAGVAPMNGSAKSRFGSCISRCRSRMMSRGESTLPTRLAGQTAVQRPHSVQASKSSRSFQVKPARALMPSFSEVSKSIFRSVAPIGASRAV